MVVEESSSVLRGRLLQDAQLSRHHGLALPLEIRHDEFTVDTTENRILRAAMEWTNCGVTKPAEVLVRHASATAGQYDRT